MFFSEDGKRCYTYSVTEFREGDPDIRSFTEDFVNAGGAAWTVLHVVKTVGDGHVTFDIDFTEFRG